MFDLSMIWDTCICSMLHDNKQQPVKKINSKPITKSLIWEFLIREEITLAATLEINYVVDPTIAYITRIYKSQVISLIDVSV